MTSSFNTFIESNLRIVICATELHRANCMWFEESFSAHQRNCIRTNKVLMKYDFILVYSIICCGSDEVSTETCKLVSYYEILFTTNYECSRVESANQHPTHSYFLNLAIKSNAHCTLHMRVARKNRFFVFIPFAPKSSLRIFTKTDGSNSISKWLTPKQQIICDEKRRSFWVNELCALLCAYHRSALDDLIQNPAFVFRLIYY